MSELLKMMDGFLERLIALEVQVKEKHATHHAKVVEKLGTLLTQKRFDEYCTDLLNRIAEMEARIEKLESERSHAGDGGHSHVH